MIIKLEEEEGGYDHDEEGMHDEVYEVAEAVWRSAKLFYGIFDYFAALFSETETAKGEPDIYNISFN